jgi:amidase
VPITIKVNVDVEGQATTNGLPAWANYIAPGDSAVVANVKRAGRSSSDGRTRLSCRCG